MKSPLNKIFHQEGTISRQQTEDYLNGKLQGEEKLRVERILSDNNLEAEAMEGLEMDPEALSVLPATLSLSENQTISNKNTYRNLFWSVSILALASLVVAIYFSRENKKMLQEKNEQPLSQTVVSKNETLTLTPEEEKAEITEIDNAVPIEQTEQITYKKTIENQAETVIDEPEKENEVVIDEQNKNPDPVEIKKANVIEEAVPENKVARSNVKFTYLHDLKVVDYSGLYTSGIKKTEQSIQSGTAANLENSNDRNEMQPEIRITYVPYEKYLEDCLSDFTRNDFKGALKKFKIILQHYPEDLNSFFYGGLCYYNLGKFDKAISYFDQCINNSFSTFEEEAEWYKALCLIKNKDQEAAIQLLQQIVREKGFYATKADAKIKELK